MPNLELRFKTIGGQDFEIIDYHQNGDGSNYAVIHMPDNTPTPYVTVWNLCKRPTLNGLEWEWDLGHYCATRWQAEKKFYELTGVIKGKTRKG